MLEVPDAFPVSYEFVSVPLLFPTKPPIIDVPETLPDE
jgi:hypothetical protein